ncbi:alpha/beta hydrolase [Mucilaginibacter myungsuensis]|uniref:Alpha/beta hydrolase n=1 Tax=Mucilaginibacter myungsuensis TaxID=649104 RepID=A0A929PX99_9SPHI|nr:alpha/beta hydrolase-fold protein [Mucilaginibacter myungsuensis]MBE9662180.1 alpha/beta hydrolase [Mucilaginibacter myungsuensis]MDN3599386.1 alpha/beta hydrolase-fold protein [Mucilaginibacter myungsuensis]
MKKYRAFLIAIIMFPLIAFGQQIKTVPIKSKYVDGRNIRIWLPADYSAKKKYAVLYMHDGQMLFDSTTTWNHQEWQLDETLDRLTKTKKMRDLIVVGIDNNGAKRLAEFFPQAVVGTVPQPERAELDKLMPSGPIADNYLKFIVTELKPYIDANYSTYGDAAHTFIGGSSLGGMISLYAVCSYPQIFSGAFCMSTHWTGTFVQNTAIPDAMVNYLDKKLPSTGGHRFYFDHGTITLDSLYAPAQVKVDALFKRKGYGSKNFKSLVFEGASHSERDWAKRLDEVLVFLIGK